MSQDAGMLLVVVCAVLNAGAGASPRSAGASPRHDCTMKERSERYLSTN